MTNPTQPIEHFTLEQVEQKIGVERGYCFTLSPEELYDFLNAAINELIGEPEYYILDVNHAWISATFEQYSRANAAYRTIFYTLKEIK